MYWETIRNNWASFNIAVIASGHDSLQRLWNSLWIFLPEFIIVKAMQSATVIVQLNVLGDIWQKCTLWGNAEYSQSSIKQKVVEWSEHQLMWKKQTQSKVGKSCMMEVGSNVRFLGLYYLYQCFEQLCWKLYFKDCRYN